MCSTKCVLLNEIQDDALSTIDRGNFKTNPNLMSGQEDSETRLEDSETNSDLF